MKNVFLTCLLLLFVSLGFAQQLNYDIRGDYRSPITKATLNTAKSMTDINPGYPSSWVSGYISVAVQATCNGKVMMAYGKDEQLSKDQLRILKMADIGTEVVVDVRYNPDAASGKNTIKKIHFTYTVIPEVEARYPGGKELLNQYVKQNVIDKIDTTFIKQLKLVTVRFSIDKNGYTTDVQIDETSGYDNIDQLLLKTINTMQKWQPAENAKGEKVQQDFVLSLGNAIGC